MPEAAEVTTETSTESQPQVVEAIGTPIGGGKNVVLPTAAIGKLKAEARERGKREAMADLEKQAKAAGFESVQSMFTHIATLTKSGGGNGAVSNGRERTKERVATPTPNREPEREPEEPAARAQNGHSNGNGNGNGHSRSWKDQQRFERQLERERKARDDERRIRLSEERRRKNAERSHEALEAEMALREQAIHSGVKDVDYAVTLLRRSIDGKTEEELKGFDEVKFFGDLREKQPYLFGEVARPVTTGTGSKAPPAPTPGAVAQKAAQDGQIDATKMKPDEFKEHVKKRGFSMSSF